MFLARSLGIFFIFHSVALLESLATVSGIPTDPTILAVVLVFSVFSSHFPLERF